MALLNRFLRTLYPLYQGTVGRPLRKIFFMDLIKRTGNFDDITWMGQPIWQNILDLWVIQETIVAVKPVLLVESGTHRGGSALFYAHLFDLIGTGRVTTVDIETRHALSHPRITFLLGSSISPEILAQVRSSVAEAGGPVMVLLDSDHSASHVR